MSKTGNEEEEEITISLMEIKEDDAEDSWDEEEYVEKKGTSENETEGVKNRDGETPGNGLHGLTREEHQHLQFLTTSTNCCIQLILHPVDVLTPRSSVWDFLGLQGH